MHGERPPPLRAPDRRPRQFGDVTLRVEPLAPGKGFEFENKVVGGAIPREYIPAVERGVEEAMDSGVLAGYPMVDVRVTPARRLVPRRGFVGDGVQDRGLDGVQGGLRKAEPKLLEPIMDVEVVVPEEYMGDVIGDLSARRGRIGGMFTRAEARVVAASVPLAEMFGYATRMRSISQGRAVYSMQFSRYEHAARRRWRRRSSRRRGVTPPAIRPDETSVPDRRRKEVDDGQGRSSSGRSRT